MTETLSLFPMIGFFIYATSMFIKDKFNFNLHLSILIISLSGYAYISLSNGGSWIILILQTILAFASFICMVAILSRKASGETMMVFTAMVTLAPVSVNFLFGLIGFLMSLALFLIYASFFYKKELTDASNSIKDLSVTSDTSEESIDLSDSNILDVEKSLDISKGTTEVTGTYEKTLKNDLIMGVLSTYDGQLKLPNYDYLPDKADTKNAKRISFSIFVLIAHILLGLGNFAYISLFLDK